MGGRVITLFCAAENNEVCKMYTDLEIFVS